MKLKPLPNRVDPINSRILVRNSHKFVYKKLSNQNRDEWCQKYLSVATSKLLDPKNTTKLPFSLPKKPSHKSTQLHLQTHSSFILPKKKTQVLAIDNMDLLERSSTIDQQCLIKASKKAQRLLEQMKRSVMRTPLRAQNNREVGKSGPILKIKYHYNYKYRSKDEFQIEPWLVENGENDNDNENGGDDKENRFF